MDRESHILASASNRHEASSPKLSRKTLLYRVLFVISFAVSCFALFLSFSYLLPRMFSFGSYTMDKHEIIICLGSALIGIILQLISIKLLVKGSNRDMNLPDPEQE